MISVFLILLVVVSMMAGLLGSLIGLGGGIFIVPALTLLFGVDIHDAIGASIVCVIASSTGSVANFLRNGFCNIRLALVLELTTTIGAVCGAHLAGIISEEWLYVIFGIVLAYSGIAIWRGKPVREMGEAQPDKLSDYLRLHGQYYDRAFGRMLSYKLQGSRVGMTLGYFAGLISGLLGVGGGVLKVPMMNLAMRVPIKVSSATSSLMIGMTASASAGVFFLRGEIQPFVAAPVAVGVLLGASLGSRFLSRLKVTIIRRILIVVLILVAGQMVFKGMELFMAGASS